MNKHIFILSVLLLSYSTTVSAQTTESTLETLEHQSAPTEMVSPPVGMVLTSVKVYTNPRQQNNNKLFDACVRLNNNSIACEQVHTVGRARGNGYQFAGRLFCKMKGHDDMISVSRTQYGTSTFPNVIMRHRNPNDSFTYDVRDHDGYLIMTKVNCGEYRPV